MVISGKLTSWDLKRMADELRQYGTDLQTKLRLFVSRLADKGIQAALNANYGSYASYIVFSKETESNGTVIVARETSLLTADWLGHEDVEISPLLMTEFGAGNYAVYWENSDGMENRRLSDGTPIGRGSFPNQKNAFKDHWLYRDTEGYLHISRGFYPTRPMHHAVIEIITQVESTAREVFGNGSSTTN